MNTLQAALFLLAYAGYAASLALYLLYAFTRGERFAQWARGLLWAAAPALAAGLLLRVGAAQASLAGAWYVPWTSWFDSLSFFALFISAVFLLVQAESHLPILGAFVMPWAGLALAAAALQPASEGARLFDVLSGAARSAALSLENPAFQSFWMLIHVPLVFAAYAAFANAFGIGVAYLIQERQIKSKKPGDLCYRLPALEDLDRLIYRIILFAFPLLTLGLAFGALWAHGVWGRWWAWDAKETWSLITWSVYLGYLYMRLGAGWRGRRAAYLSMAGFAVVLFTYVGVNYISRRHDFLSQKGQILRSVE